MPKFPCIRICWASNMYPTFRTGATNRDIDPTVDPSVDRARISPQKPFREIDDDMDSTSGSLTGCRSGKKTRSFYRARRLEWKVEKPKTTAFHSWMHGGHVGHVEPCEFCRGHLGKLGSCVYNIVYTHSQHAESSAKLERDQSCTRHTVLLASIRRKDT